MARSRNPVARLVSSAGAVPKPSTDRREESIGAAAPGDPLRHPERSLTGAPAATPPAGRPPAGPLPVALDHQSHETLVAVRSQLVHRWFGVEAEQRALAIVSADHGDGRTYVSAHLARLFAALEEDTLLIDADLRRPALHAVFDMDNACGLTSYLAGEVDHPPVRAVPGVPHLFLLPSGPPASDPHLLLSRRRFGLMLGDLAERFSYILLDTPATASAGDALTVALRSSGALLVTNQNRTRIADVRALAQRLTDSTVEVVGAVINAGP